MLHNILNNYSQFFNLEVIKASLSNLNNWGIILTLVVLEGLLSSDNALVLAMMVKHLPKKEQKKALTYGIWGAYIFRFIAIGIGTYLIKIWWVKIIAGLYLLYMVFNHFKPKKEESKTIKAVNKGLWATIFTVELMDIAFSIDSVTAAFGISNQVWVLFLGAILGILMMRFVANLFVKLIDKIPELEDGAYILIAFVGIKMIIEIFNIKVPDFVFYIGLIVIFLSTIVFHKIRNKK